VEPFLGSWLFHVGKRKSSLPAGKMVLTVFAGIAEFERALIRERTGAGRAAAKKRGVKFGTPPKLTPEQVAPAVRLVDEGRSVPQVASTFGVHAATITRCPAEVTHPPSV